MNTQLLEIQPRELKFIYELKKQSSCSVRLVNKSGHHVAFKVKTTSPKNYCVRPNIGIIKPKSSCDFIITMQAPRSARSDTICKDKFLVQSTVVPVGTIDEDITSSMFAKDDGKYVEENKLRVILVSPPHSPVMSPINGTLKQAPVDDTSVLKDQVLSKVEIISPHHTVTEDVDAKTENDEDLVPAKDMEFKTVEDMKEWKLDKDVEEMKSNLYELESKLKEAELTILKLMEEKRLSSQERENLQRELAQLRSKKSVRRVRAGFPLLFVCMVALVSVMLGYLLHR